MIALDTSVTVAAALPWHEAHAPARAALPHAPTRIIAQVAAETYSVLTRLPPPQRVPADVARGFLAESFEFPPFVLGPDRYGALLDRAVAEGIAGGGLYDAIVALTALDAGVTLLSLDRRAARTYERLGVDYRFVG